MKLFKKIMLSSLTACVFLFGSANAAVAAEKNATPEADNPTAQGELKCHINNDGYGCEIVIHF
ncbi:MAG: hypothetical protein VX447_02580 [Pseudomonadota bacterium]|uniref:hypothetical protein n=1 Tax=Gallaecimonas pentaromativorans TaxID=584787 RepID=UPI00067F557F|nr:hypothetical protein [Gallaecimonas pentaromativorans]MED5523631.1 hypothetical protein [Pseudomonadota bacterium]